jgi:RIO kinase 1
MERESIDSALESFLADGLITDIIGIVKSGKEATVYCCKGGPSSGLGLLAAKHYRQVEYRNFRNDAVYAPGRYAALSSRSKRALQNKTRHGRDVQFGFWINSEYETLRILHSIGADVPKPVARSGSALLMEYVGDDSAPAPMLSRIALDAEDASAAFDRLLKNVTLWLRYDRIHGDLSAYNVLYWRGAPKVIDFPQAIDARLNPNAYSLLQRDLENLIGYFARSGIRVDPQEIAADLWGRYSLGEL